MSLTNTLRERVETWNAAADMAANHGDFRTAITFRNTAELVTEILDTPTYSVGFASRPFDAEQVEFGVRWPDGRVVPTAESELAYWEHNTELDIVARTVTDWRITKQPAVQAA